MTNDDGDLVQNDTKITLVNHFAACLFSQVEVYLNGVQMAYLSSAVTYPWRMFLQSFLNYNSDVKKIYLAAKGYYPESANQVATIIPTASTPSLNKRKQLISEGKKVYFNTRLAVDLFDTDRYLPPNVDIKIKLVRSAEKFGLLQENTAKSFKIVLKDVKLHI